MNLHLQVPDVKLNLLSRAKHMNPVRSLIQNYFSVWICGGNSCPGHSSPDVKLNLLSQFKHMKNPVCSLIQKYSAIWLCGDNWKKCPRNLLFSVPSFSIVFKSIFYCMRYLSCLCIILLAIIKNYLALHHVIFQKMKHLNKTRFSTLVNNTFVSLSPAVCNICGHCWIPTLKKERFVNSTYQV